jgi:hypothetical protein
VTWAGPHVGPGKTWQEGVQEPAIGEEEVK